MDLEVIDKIADRYKRKESALIGILQDIQAQYNYLPKEALLHIRERLSIPLTHILGVATFYNIFTLKPRGRHLINVCMGTACHVKGVVRILEKIERELGIKTGETTADLRFSLEPIRCLGCCSLAPVVKIDGDIYGKVKQEKVSRILKKYE
ncbi:NADH-quinone oxidoreductase subunit E [Candidatus Aerophobetes bacterium Ae_b3a]|uniref:NADH-quinone oxidoreductase subunit NuoE n=1 Tax=Aerophobetes bacterium TaxID=2030807 RepID=A0A523S522_UNCAE|nr:MAG: NADH-quinone oxidoreductase subunit NuoE [Candidatus Aerophobetes bacterium]TKJ47273.1 MAG: NADH-quinone oxidoreductase subunit E [Candidatus Aerophobetes bacterium Ae_b3a]